MDPIGCKATRSISRHFREAAVGIINAGGQIRLGVPDRRLKYHDSVGADTRVATAQDPGKFGYVRLP